MKANQQNLRMLVYLEAQQEALSIEVQYMEGCYLRFWKWGAGSGAWDVTPTLDLLPPFPLDVI